jgi:8-oxo-dGTP pyrophosphatase MutT (NUDIX family)
MKKAYGGVVINQAREVLLREPTDHYHGLIWTFPKGKPRTGETPEQTALREVWEETGVHAVIVDKIPGTFGGSRTSSEYFLMHPVEETGSFDHETQSIRWVSREEARRLVLLSLRPKRRRRDLRVLKLGYALLARFEKLNARRLAQAIQAG